MDQDVSMKLDPQKSTSDSKENTTVKAKRRIQPTLISPAPPSYIPSSKSTESSKLDFVSLSSEKSRSYLHTNENPEIKTRKRKSSSIADDDDLSVGARKLSKGNFGQMQISSSQLEPFYFLITSPPQHVHPWYSELSSWFEKTINGSSDPEICPFSLVTPLSQGPHSSLWNELIRSVNNKSLLEDNWRKFTLVDKIITMFGEDDWHERNLPFMSLQRHVWWISQVHRWFSTTRCASTEEYIQTSMSALILELFYRFVWARLTQNIYFSQIKPKDLLRAENEVNIDDNLGIMDEDDILDQSELGEGSESESQSEMENSMDDSASEHEILKRTEIEDITSLGYGLYYKFKGKNSGDDNSEDSDSGEEVEELYDSDSASDDFNDWEERRNLKLAKKQSKGLIGEECIQNSRSEKDASSSQENSNFEIPRVIPLFFAHPDITQTIDQIESQFFEKVTISVIQNQNQQKSLTETKAYEWDIHSAFTKLADLACERNADFQMRKMTKSKINNYMNYLYNSVFAPFLKQVGISFLPDNDESDNQSEEMQKRSSDLVSKKWTFNHSFGDYYFDNILKHTFSNLTQQGQAPARHFIALFSNLFLLADAKTESLISHVYQDIHSQLMSAGKITPQLEQLISTLDSLAAEKSLLLRQIRKQTRATKGDKKEATKESKLADDVDVDDEEEDDDDAVPSNWVPNALEAQLHSHRISRVAQIDQMMSQIQDEFNILTGSIDKIQSKRKRRTKTESQMDMTNWLAADSSSNLPTEEELWGLPSTSIQPDQK